MYSVVFPYEETSVDEFINNIIYKTCTEYKAPPVEWKVLSIT